MLHPKYEDPLVDWLMAFCFGIALAWVLVTWWFVV